MRPLPNGRNPWFVNRAYTTTCDTWDDPPSESHPFVVTKTNSESGAAETILLGPGLVSGANLLWLTVLSSGFDGSKKKKYPFSHGKKWVEITVISESIHKKNNVGVFFFGGGGGNPRGCDYMCFSAIG